MSSNKPGTPTPRRGTLGLGELETAVLDVLWQSTAPQTVREVLTILAPRRKLAYTTVQTVLDKLHRKGWARRHRDGRAYAYTATTSREETAARVLHSLLHSAEQVDAALLHFVSFTSRREQDVLRDALNTAPSPAASGQPRRDADKPSP